MELWVHALEYTSWDDALVAIDVSKAFRSASRFALTKGRWAPVIKVVLAVMSFPWHRHGFDRRNHLDDVKAQFRAAWHAREPLLLVAILDSVHNYRARDMERILGALLCAAEPAIATTRSHNVVTLEHVEAGFPRGPVHQQHFRRLVPACTGGGGHHRFSPPMTGFLAYSMPLKRASAGVMRVMCCTGGFHILGYDDAAEFETEAAVQRMTAGWSDEHKRDELVAVFRRVEHQRKADERQRRDEEEFREIREMERIAGGW